MLYITTVADGRVLELKDNKSTCIYKKSTVLDSTPFSQNARLLAKTHIYWNVCVVCVRDHCGCAQIHELYGCYELITI